MGLKDIIIGVTLTGLFAVGLLSFGIIFADDQSSTYSIADEDFVNEFNAYLQENLEDFKGETETEKKSLEEAGRKASTESETFGLISIISNAFAFISLMFGTFNILTDGVAGIIGIPTLVINVIFSAMTITIVLLAWRVWKAGGT